ncbi:MAG TPA: glycosyltransferase family 4 protein [Phycisphaerae bacterium]|nr:glycosyltransferase family 4 protein [Phycisphaerae bacterium]
MPTLLHVLDASCNETQLQLLHALRSRQATDACTHIVCGIDGTVVDRAHRLWGDRISRAEARLAPLNWSPRLPGLAREHNAGLVHAWGIEAAIACATRLPDLPLVLTLPGAEPERAAARWIGSFPTDATVVAGSQALRSRLVAAGLAPERTVVIRGPVDFAGINRARQSDLRRRMTGDAKPVILLSGPPSPDGGQYYALWAAAIVRQIYPDLRVIMPYDSAEARRLRRFVDGIRMPSLITVPDPKLSWAELVACADILLAPAVDEICTDPLAMAMAAGVVIVGSAVRSIAELIADHQTGLLCKPRQPRRLAARLLTAIEDRDLCRRMTDAARAQAYECFGLRSFLDSYSRLYENVLLGRMPSDGVRDPLMVA